MARAKRNYRGMTREIEIGKPYQDASSRRRSSGVFEVFPGKDGLVHIPSLPIFE